MSYSTIFLDADGTLLDFHAAEKAALEEAIAPFADADSTPRIAEAYGRINAELWALFEQGGIGAADLRTRRFERLVEETNLPTDPSVLAQHYLERLGRQGALLPGALRLLEAAKSSATLVLITNGFSEVQRSRLRLSEIDHHFDAIVISEEVGCSKPDTRIFEHAARLIDAHDKTSMLMVGDSLSSDIAGGTAFGIDTCLIADGDPPPTMQPQPTYVVRHPDEVIAIIESR